MINRTLVVLSLASFRGSIDILLFTSVQKVIREVLRITPVEDFIHMKEGVFIVGYDIGMELVNPQ